MICIFEEFIRVFCLVIQHSVTFEIVKKPFPRVKEIRAYTTAKKPAPESESADQGADCHDVAKGHWIDGNLPTNLDFLDPLKDRENAEFHPIANPMSGYSKYQTSRKSWGINAMGSLVVEVEADDLSLIHI